MSGIIDVSKKIEEKLLLDRNLEQQVFFEISKIVSEAYQHSMAQSGKGYCYKFNLPFNAVTKKLYKLLDLTNEEVFKAFKKDWGQGAMKNRMHKDPYYQILLLLIYYGIKNNKKVITENAFFILLMKLWNGRKEKFIRYCDEKTMNYVVANMSKKFVITKYDGPLFLLKDYFVPTLLKKYSQQIKTDPAGRLGLRRLFEQSWSRIRQIFVFNKQRNLASGKDEYTGGIAPLYYQAKREGAKLDTTSIGKNEDSEQIDLMSVNEREDIANDVTDYIVSNTKRNVSITFINALYRDSNVNKELIKVIIQGLADYNLHKYISELILLILSRLNIQQKEDICKADIYSKFKRTIVSSKNNPDVAKIRRLCNTIINKIFEKNQINIDIEKNYTPPTAGKIRLLLLNVILSDMKKVICHQQVVGKKFMHFVKSGYQM